MYSVTQVCVRDSSPKAFGSCLSFDDLKKQQIRVERGHIQYFLVACDVISVGMKLDNPSKKSVIGMHRQEDRSVVVMQ